MHSVLPFLWKYVNGRELEAPVPIQVQTAPLLILLSFLRDGVSKLNSQEPHVICMPDFALTL